MISGSPASCCSPFFQLLHQLHALASLLLHAVQILGELAEEHENRGVFELGTVRLQPLASRRLVRERACQEAKRPLCERRLSKALAVPLRDLGLRVSHRGSTGATLGNCATRHWATGAKLNTGATTVIPTHRDLHWFAVKELYSHATCYFNENWLGAVAMA